MICGTIVEKLLMKDSRNGDAMEIGENRRVLSMRERIGNIHRETL